MTRNPALPGRFAAIVTLMLVSKIALSWELRTHESLCRIALRNRACTADVRLKEDCDFPDGLGTTDPGQGWTMVGWSMEGGIREDDWDPFSLIRPYRHFYNPVSDLGLRDLESGVRSLIWAWKDPENADGWNRARYRFRAAIEGERLVIRKNALADAFECLGRVMHLVQDLAQPQHTRNDAHPRNAGIETYADRWYGTAQQFDDYFSKISWNNDNSFTVDYPLPIIRESIIERYQDELDAGIPRFFKALWDTDQYEGQNNFGGFSTEYSPGLAEISNFYCVTDDTMFTGEQGIYFSDIDFQITMTRIEPNHKHFFRYPKLIDTDIYKLAQQNANLKFMRLYRHGENASGEDIRFNYARMDTPYAMALPDMFSGIKFFRWETNPQKSKGYLGIGPHTFESYCQFLLPKAITYSTKLANYFFRGKLEVTATKNNQGIVTLEITNRSTDDIGPGIWKLFANVEASSNEDDRVPISRRINWGTIASGLERNQTKRVTYPSRACNSITVLFSGELGDEKIGIATKTVAAP